MTIGSCRRGARLDARTQEQVLAKIGRRQAYLDELDGDAARGAAVAAEDGVDLTPDATPEQPASPQPT